MFKISSDFKVTTPINMLNRFQESKSKEHNEFSITIYDKFGNNFNGFFEQLSTISNTVLISDKSGNFIFFDIDHLAHVVLHDAQLHLNFLQYSAPTKKVTENSNIDLDERIQLLQQMLQKNYSLSFQFSIDQINKNNKIESENIAVLLDFLSENIRSLASDDFNLTALKKVSSFHIINTTQTKFSLKLNEETISIYINFEDKLPFNINELIEKGFNRVL